MVRWIPMVMVLLSVVLLTDTCTKKKGKPNMVEIELESGTKIRIELYPDVAPKTVQNFQTLIEKKFYDGLKFHRVIPGFVAQGGDPNGDGTGGPGYTIPAEFNERSHERGAVAMARTSDPNSAGSQFYIVLEPQPHLDRQYTVFGKVVSGMESVDRIKPGDRMKQVRLVD